ncbi:MAG: hypothetical protein HN742_08975 [Lentisphaerae bacterium]|jgi:putative FmdB family regulatory protein|nr:hypothetical protein [Lentisphaerota bacterium]MBT4818968.1 hypothetical protein [Lentisphaerota bacterium]MBT5610647.1 hypothetical protein [Lentisphaerota bacterium]MBT7057304.1 hypothetical protein [Lentisphaerota bacterium]MBT7841992.1 hypothetical protein [Lentisphaerota bacterium]
MPTYEYKCLDCDDRFEVVQSMKDDALAECTKCQGRLKRLIGTGAGIIFKGSGFYCTDYRSDSYKSAAKKDKPAPASTSDSSSSSTSSDTKTSTPKKDS